VRHWTDYLEGGTDNLKSALVAPSRRGLTRWECLVFIALVVALALPFGIFYRFPFDDEVATLGFIAGYSPSELLLSGLGDYDRNIPPLSYLMFQLLAHFGVPVWGMRLTSQIMSGIAFLLILDLTIAIISSEDKIVRFTTMFLFLSFPLLYGAGDALRWYPMFAVFISGFFWLEFRRGRPTMLGGMLLGLAASTTYLAIIPYFAFVTRRYLRQRSFDIRVDGPFHLVLASFAAPGLISFAMIVAYIIRTGDDPSGYLHFSTLLSGFVGIAQAGLGFLGGYRIGPVDIVLGLPYLALLVLTLASWVLRQRGKSSARNALDDWSGDLFIIFGVMAAFCALYSLASGFNEGRVWLFLAPFTLACFALGYWDRFPRISFLPLFIVSFLLFSVALANGRKSDAPYKRNSVIPFDEVVNFIGENVHGSVLYVANEPVGAFLLQDSGYCFWDYPMPPCVEQGLDHFDTIVIVDDSYLQTLPHVDTILAEIGQHRTLRTKARFGYDRWASLKSLLTGTALDPWILTVEVYR
jgi:hypothetical protein